MTLTENIEQDNLKLIRLDNNEFIITNSQAEIGEKDPYYDEKQEKICTGTNNYILGGYKKKIIFATSGLNLDGVCNINKDDYSLENAISFAKKHFYKTFETFEKLSKKGTITVESLKSIIEVCVKAGHKFGYKQAQQELYTKEEVLEAMNWSALGGGGYSMLKTELELNNDYLLKIKVEVDLKNNTAKFI